MRKYFALAAVIAAVGVGLGASQAIADNGALRYVSCPDTTFTDTVGGFTINYCFQDVVTSSGNANALLSGVLVDPSTAPSKATTVAGFGCIADFGNGGVLITTDTRLTVTPSGNVNGTCKFH